MKKEPMWRLTADKGKVLTDGTDIFPCIDVAPNDDPDRYTEIDNPDYNPQEEEQENEEG